GEAAEFPAVWAVSCPASPSTFQGLHSCTSHTGLLWLHSSSLNSKHGKGTLLTEEFKLVYRFPGIKYCRILSRLKLLQTATSMIMLPPICYLYLQGQVSQNILLYTTGIAVFAGAMLYGMSYFFRRIIGLIYLSETGQTVRVAHLTFWGRRNDIYCPIDTVVTLDEVGDSKDELLHQFKRYNSTDTLYFTIKYGQIVDRQKFTQIFGEFVDIQNNSLKKNQ
uniref:Transmembrane protein 186 n=1 Tax=Zonotrichia albicollis TaxID=44394 RepID=A0A8D2QIW5_ZONAL